MKFVILAAMIGYVFGAATGADCSAAVLADPATATDYVGPCDGDTEATDSAAEITTCAANDQSVTGCALADGESAVSSDAAGTAGAACRTGADLVASIAIGSTTAAADAVTCDDSNAAGVADTCDGEVVGTSAGTCTAVAIADGADFGNCLAAVTACDTDVTVSTDGTYCSADTDGATVLGTAGEAAGADGGAPRTVVAGDDRCTNTATVVGSPETSCTCGATPVVSDDGADTKPCRAVVAADANGDGAVTACDTGLECTGFVAAVAQAAAVTDCASGLTCKTAIADATDADWCQSATDTPATATADAAAGAVGGPCTADLVAAVTAVTGEAGTCGAATDESPAAIFYGMSMVTAAIAYLL